MKLFLLVTIVLTLLSYTFTLESINPRNSPQDLFLQSPKSDTINCPAIGYFVGKPTNGLGKTVIYLYLFNIQKTKYLPFSQKKIFQKKNIAWGHSGPNFL